MGKPTPDNPSAEAPVQAVPGGAEAMVIRAEPGKPWPEPPTAGRWVRHPKTGDLTCMEPPVAAPSEEERRARREKQRDAAIQAANKQSVKE